MFLKIVTISANTGKMIVATATFDVSSVTVAEKRHTINKIATTFIELRPVNDSPSILDSPDFVLPVAMANPPPRTNIKLQCIF